MFCFQVLPEIVVNLCKFIKKNIFHFISFHFISYSPCQKNVNRTTISPIIRDHTEHKTLTHLLLGRQGYHSQAAAYENWLVKCSLTLWDLVEATHIILNIGGSPFCSHGGSPSIMPLVALP